MNALSRLRAVDLLKLKDYETPQGYAGHEGDAFVRFARMPATVLTSDEARAWAELLLREADEADEAVIEQEEDRARAIFDGEADLPHHMQERES